MTIDIDADAGFITVDLRDNPDCVDAGMNLTRVTSTMAAAQAVFACLDPDIPHNAGSFRRLEVLLRENCVVGIPRFPHSCSVATTNMTDMIINLIQSAFATLGDGYGFSQGNSARCGHRRLLGQGLAAGRRALRQPDVHVGGRHGGLGRDRRHARLGQPGECGPRLPRQHRGERAALPVSGGQRPRAGRFVRRRAPARAGRHRRSSSAPATTRCWSSTSATGSPSCAGRARRPALTGRLTGQDCGRRHRARSTRPTHTAIWSRARGSTPSTMAGAAYGDPLEREPGRVLDDVNERYVSPPKRRPSTAW